MRPQRIWYTEDSGKGVSTLFQNIQHFSHTQKPVNEDACGFGRSFLFVLDGATGLGKREFMHAGSDAHWLSGSIRDRLLRELPQGSDPIIVLKEELHRLRSQYLQAARTMPSAAETPSACIALFYEWGDWLYYFGMGDCYGVVELKNGQVEVISDPILEELDQQALMRMKEISRIQQIPFFEAADPGTIDAQSDVPQPSRRLSCTGSGMGSTGRDRDPPVEEERCASGALCQRWVL